MKFKVLRLNENEKFLSEEEYKLEQGQECRPYFISYYIKECESPGFPPREGMKYFVRIKGCFCKCYCFQLGRWWEYKENDNVHELYVPQIMTHYEFSKLRCAVKFLSKKALADFSFYYYEDKLKKAIREAEKRNLKYEVIFGN